MCANGCSNNCSCKDTKYFSSEVKYDGAAVPCLDTEGTIIPPYSGLNALLQLITEKLCQLDQTAAQGAPGTDGTDGTDGVGIVSILWLSNSGGQPQGTQGTTDTYEITLTDASTYNFVVTNGADGAGTDFVFEAPAGITASLTGVAGPGSSVVSVNSSGANVSGKYYTLNLNGQLNITGTVGDTLGIDFNLSSYLPNNLANTVYSTINFDPLTTPSLFNSSASVFGLVGGQALKVNNFPLPENYTSEIVNFNFQISFMIM